MLFLNNIKIYRSQTQFAIHKLNDSHFKENK